jgi:hypothetical protein
MIEEGRRFRSLTDSDLVDLLYTASDQLPRSAVDEILRRGPRMLEPLREIVMDKSSWLSPLPEWWAVVHATYLLGAMESPETLVPLLTALRWADAFDCDWVTEDLPSIFGRLGTPAREPLLRVAHDPTAGPGARSIALASLAAIALPMPHLREEVVGWAARLLADSSEGLYLRQTAANILLDFRCQQHKALLVRFGQEEAKRKREDAEYSGAFYDWEVEDLLAEGEGEASQEYYRRDWLTFYDPEEVERRQERWRREQEEADAQAPTEPAAPQRDLDSPCPCGSGRPFSRCCYLKVH